MPGTDAQKQSLQAYFADAPELPKPTAAQRAEWLRDLLEESARLQALAERIRPLDPHCATMIRAAK